MNPQCISLVIGLGICLAATAVGQDTEFARADYWQKREDALSHYTFVWEMETHDLFLARKVIPDQKIDLSGHQVVVSGPNQNYEFTRKSRLTFARDGDECSVVGETNSYDIGSKKGDGLPIRTFFGKDWVGSITETPMNGDFKKGYFEVFPQPIRAIYGRANQSGHEFDGELAPFLTSVSPFNIYGLPWSTQSNGHSGVRLSAQNFEGLEHVTNLMASSAPVEYAYHLEPGGRLAAAEVYVDRQTNPGKLASEVVKVTGYRLVAGFEIPSDVSAHTPRDISGRLYSGYHDVHWRLVDVYPTVEQPKPPIPLGITVADWRLQVKEYDVWNLPGQISPVFYKWTGQLPTLDELKGIQARQPQPPTESAWTPWLAYGGPIILIVVGVVLVLRGRRSKS